MSVETWSPLLWLLFMVKTAHDSELNFRENFTENLIESNLDLLWGIFAMKPIYFHAYLKSYPTCHFLLELPKASGNKQGWKGSLDLFLCLTLAI